MDQPYFTVIIPTYNRAGFIAKTIDSVLAQTFADWEVIVVDDGSTDETAKVVASFTDERVSYHFQENHERAVARNTGTALASGKYITFLDSDDFLKPDHLAAALETAREHTVPEFVHLGYSFLDPATGNTREIDDLPATANERLIDGNCLSCDGVFLRRDIAVRHPFNTDRGLSGSEDYELWLRLAARYPLYCSNRVTSVIVEHDARSMNEKDRDKLLKRIGLLEKYVLADDEFVRRFGRLANRLRANLHIYVALHLALSKAARLDALRYMTKAVASSPTVLRNRVFYGTLKRLFV